MTSGKAVGAAKTKVRKVRSKPLRKGLCSNCVRLAMCTYTVLLSPPLVQCDEYDSGAELSSAAPGAALSRPGASKGDLGPAEADAQHMGLCRTCAGRAACAFPRPEGGVWQCEEYI